MRIIIIIATVIARPAAAAPAPDDHWARATVHSWSDLTYSKYRFDHEVGLSLSSHCTLREVDV
jgi:hypothetical protein